MAPTTSEPVHDIDPSRAAALLIAARRGRHDALHSLVQMCEPHIRRQARRYAWHRDQADDVAQDVWIRLLTKADQIHDPRTLLAWLSVVTRRSAAEIGRHEARAAATPDSDHVVSAASTEDEAIGRCGRDAVIQGISRALDRLDESERRLILLLHRDDRPDYADIGQTVKRPVGSLGPTRRRLLDRMRTDADVARLETFAATA